MLSTWHSLRDKLFVLVTQVSDVTSVELTLDLTINRVIGTIGTRVRRGTHVVRTYVPYGTYICTHVQYTCTYHGTMVRVRTYV